MKTNWLLGVAVGIATGITLVVACSDDSPDDADAAVCDCPAAEPPLAGRITSVRDMNPITPGGAGITSVDCPAGATVIAGACEVMDVDANVVVMESRFTRGSQQGYLCRWSALNATANNTGFAEAICLMPAP